MYTNNYNLRYPAEDKPILSTPFLIFDWVKYTQHHHSQCSSKLPTNTYMIDLLNSWYLMIDLLNSWYLHDWSAQQLILTWLICSTVDTYMIDLLNSWYLHDWSDQQLILTQFICSSVDTYMIDLLNSWLRKAAEFLVCFGGKFRLFVPHL